MNLARRGLGLARIAMDFRARRETVRARPIRLWVESSSHCNLRCGMCLNRITPAAEKGHMDFALFRRIADQAAGFANDIYLHHRGEPLLNPRLFDMIRYARERGLRTRFHSNGTLLTEEKAVALLDARPDLVSFSVDGFERGAYERIRVGASFDATVANLFRLLRLRRERRQRRPYIVVEKIAFAEPDPPDVRAAAADLRRRFLAAGADEVIEKAEYVWASDLAPDSGRPRTASVCTFLWYAMVVLWDGTVTPCPQDFTGRLRMGDATTATLEEIWNGPAYRDLRRRMTEDLDSLAICRKCDRLCRKTAAGVPRQYLATFLIDQLVGYNRVRRWLSTAERSA